MILNYQGEKMLTELIHQDDCKKNNIIEILQVKLHVAIVGTDSS
jgi:hypothetical protein